MLGLKEDKKPGKRSPVVKNSTAGKPAEKSQNDEAKKILEQMEQKKDAGDCPFC